MPASSSSSWSWFHKLRRRRRKKSKPSGAASPVQAADAAACTDRSQCQPAAATCGYSPNRASYYFPSADRARPEGGGLRCIARRDDGGEETALDVRVDVVHRRADRLGGIDAPPATPELKLRRIVTSRLVAKNEAASDTGGSATTSAATTPSTRARGFHVKSPGRRRRRGHDGNARNEKKTAPLPRTGSGTRRRRRWLYESLVVVKESSEPERELAESMAEMVAANGIRSPEDLEELLACYLALNAAEHHRSVVAAFRRVWLLLARQRLHD